MGCEFWSHAWNSSRTYALDCTSNPGPGTCSLAKCPIIHHWWTNLLNIVRLPLQPPPPPLPSLLSPWSASLPPPQLLLPPPHYYSLPSLITTAAPFFHCYLYCYFCNCFFLLLFPLLSCHFVIFLSLSHSSLIHFVSLQLDIKNGATPSILKWSHCNLICRCYLCNNLLGMTSIHQICYADSF